MIKLDINEMEELGSSMVSLYETFKDLFPLAKNFIVNAGENEASLLLTDECRKAEVVFNEKVADSMRVFMKSISTYIENNTSWTKYISGLDSINSSKLKSSEVEDKIKPFQMV